MRLGVFVVFFGFPPPLVNPDAPLVNPDAPVFPVVFPFILAQQKLVYIQKGLLQTLYAPVVGTLHFDKFANGSG